MRVHCFPEPPLLGLEDNMGNGENGSRNLGRVRGRHDSVAGAFVTL